MLLSRNAAHSPQAAALETELDAAGITTTVASVDVTDRAALATVLASIRDQHGPIRTVVHAAAAIGWHSVSEVTIRGVRQRLRQSGRRPITWPRCSPMSRQRLSSCFPRWSGSGAAPGRVAMRPLTPISMPSHLAARPRTRCAVGGLGALGRPRSDD